MKYCIALLTVLIAGCSSGYNTTIECYSTEQFRKFTTPSFSSHRMLVRSNAQSRMDIYIQMPYRNLRFEKAASGFKASYAMTFILRNRSREIVLTKEIDRPITVQTYEESVSQRFDFHLQPFVVTPDFYSVEIIAIDGLSRLHYRSTDTVSVVNFTSPSAFASSILYLEGMSSNENGISLRPILPTSLSLLNDSVGMYQEVYHLSFGDTIIVQEKYTVPTGTDERNDDFSYLMPPYTLRSETCSRPPDSVYYSHDSTLVASGNSTMQLFQFYPLPSVGGSTVERMVILKRQGEADTAYCTENVFRRDHRYLFSVSPDEITSAMRYILREKEYDSLMSVSGLEQSERIEQFWETRGGRDRKIEFEKKIFQADKLFTTCVDGSRTAMGVVYVICGTPDYIDCRGTFIETWYYTVGDRAYSFQFRRENEKTQTYELMPFSVNDGVWQLFVDRWRRKK